MPQRFCNMILKYHFLGGVVVAVVRYVQDFSTDPPLPVAVFWQQFGQNGNNRESCSLSFNGLFDFRKAVFIFFFIQATRYYSLAQPL